MATKQADQNDLSPLMTDTMMMNSSSSSSNLCKRLLAVLVLVVSIVSVHLLIAYIMDIFPFTEESKHEYQAGLFGKWAMHGGSIKMQQKAPNQDKIEITKENIKQLSVDCVYSSENGIGFMGYPTIDNDNNVYFCDMWSGYITSLDLDNNCQERWRSHIGELLGHNISVMVNNYQSLTIFQDTNGNKGLLFGTPTRTLSTDLTDIGDYGCYAVAIYLNNGSLWWKLKIGDGNQNANDRVCALHGFMVDGHYAYGGVKKGDNYNVDNIARFIGGYVKIDIDTHLLVYRWNSINDLNKTEFDEYNRSYQGMSSYGMSGAIIDDYLIFGTSNLHDIPTYIYNCFDYALNYSLNTTYNPYLSLNQSITKDICGNNVTHIPQWRCLEQGVHVDSLIVLNKTNFKQIISIPFQGVDIFNGVACLEDNDNKTSLDHCPLFKDIILNSDIVPVAVYKDKNNKSFAAAINKAGRFHILDIERREVVITKKFAPQVQDTIFSLAIDEDSMIAIAAINGMKSMPTHMSRYTLLNNVTVCNTGSIFAFNLSTGAILWQMVHPYGRINESFCFNDTMQWNYNATNPTTCEKGEFLNINEYETVKNVDIMSVSNDTIIPLMPKDRAQFRAPLTIVGDMVFVPSDTGDIWVLNIFNGSVVHHFTCPNEYNEDYSAWNRPGIKGGISVFENRIVFYCGSYYNELIGGNVLVSMNLN